jgi:DNA replication and repair protein RecF
MFLHKLIISNFKNYSEATLEFSEKINCFTGNNGVGKTNILDAVYYLSFCKSYFNVVDAQNILHHHDFFALHGYYHYPTKTPDHISCQVKLNHRKVFKANTREYDRLSDHIGNFPLVMISPYDRDLINDGSELRRKYLDSVISQFDHSYLDHLMSYNKALQQRNALLKQMAEQRYFDAVSLEIWSEKLQSHGTPIFEKRTAFIKEFNPLFETHYQFLSGNAEQVGIDYNSLLTHSPMGDLMTESVEKDRVLRYTSTGIHKDDLDFTINGYPLKKFGSQGQQKTFVIALKLAQFEFTRKIKGFKPILLFDDIFDKLDDSRVEQIVKLVSGNNFGQVFITDTQRQRIEKIFHTISIDHKIFNVVAGTVTSEES